TVSLGDQVVRTVTRDGHWRVSLQARPAGGPYTLTIQGENKLTFNNLMYGDVYLCSGQSNMEWPIRMSAERESLLAEPQDPQLRLFLVEHCVSDQPKDTPVNKAGWNSARADFSAVAYCFGRSLRRSQGVTIGLLEASWGGTLAEAWTRREALAAQPSLAPLLKVKGVPANSPHLASRLYNGMLGTLAPYAVRGAIWYQGESNAGRAEQYKTLLATMIRDWRSVWGCGEFPFMLVQLAPYQRPSLRPGASTWAELREAQRQVSLTVPNTAMVVITDLGDEDIHPLRKQPVGERLAQAARSLVYGEAVEWSGPQLESVTPRPEGLELRFSHVGQGLQCDGPELTDFTLAEAYGDFRPARAQITGQNSVFVSCPEIKKPKRLRFGWDIYPRVNLYNSYELPASPFQYP
ncbi:sialate O-acetylesterase, partial [bacterium]|nr:sialate O-acetylesterase [bacterium]